MAKTQTMMHTGTGEGIDLRDVLAVDDDGDVVDDSWAGYRTGDESHAHVRRMDDRGSTQEVLHIALEPSGDHLLVGELAVSDDVAVATLARKLRLLRDKCGGGKVACDAGVFEFWF